DFAGRSLLPELNDYPNMIISKTFSKVLASAGLRVGMLITHPAVAEMFRAIQLPANLSTLTMAVAVKIARDDAVIAKRVAQCHRERERVARALRDIGSVDVHPSEPNFIPFRLKYAKPAESHVRFL